MNGVDIKTFFRSIVDDTPDSVYEDNLMQHAKDLIEAEREWEILKKVDATKTWATTDTYLSTKALPTDFFSPMSVFVEGYDLPFAGIPLEQKAVFEAVTGRFYIDYANSVFALTGSTTQNRVISFVYQYATPDIGDATSPVWPARFHKLISFYMAGLHQGAADWDAIAGVMSPTNRAEALLLRRSMVSWDQRLKLNSRFYRTSPIPFDASLEANMVDIDK